jgi:hypothetical protein
MRLTAKSLNALRTLRKVAHFPCPCSVEAAAGLKLEAILMSTAKPTFRTIREAKDFLVTEIADEAERSGKPLSSVERQMLYHSETERLTRESEALNDEFERDYDQDKFERRIEGLIRSSVKHAKKNEPAKHAQWRCATQELEKGDHYILLMLHHAGVRAGRDPSWSLPVAAVAFGPLALVIAVEIIDSHFHLGLLLPGSRRGGPAQYTQDLRFNKIFGEIVLTIGAICFVLMWLPILDRKHRFFTEGGYLVRNRPKQTTTLPNEKFPD